MKRIISSLLGVASVAAVFGVAGMVSAQTQSYLTFSQSNSGVTSNLSNVVASADKILVIGDNSTLLQKSGDNWIKSMAYGLPTGTNLKSIAYGAGGYMLGTTNGTIYSSYDGLNWQFLGTPAKTSLNPAPPMAGSINGLSWSPGNNGTWVAVDEAGYIYYLGSNNTWAHANDNGDVTDRYDALTSFGVNGFVACGLRGNAEHIAISNDLGKNWNHQTKGLYNELLGVASGNGVLVCVGKKASILTSSDNGITWSAQHIADLSATAINGVTYAGTYGFVAVGDQGVILQSLDNGKTWIRLASGTTQNLKNVAYQSNRTSPGSVVIVGDNGTILTSSITTVSITASQNTTTSTAAPAIAVPVDIYQTRNRSVKSSVGYSPLSETISTNPCYQFTQNLGVGSTGSQVVALQTWLIANGYDIFPITHRSLAKGFYSDATASAVKLLQAAAGIEQSGYFGPLTRAYVNAKCPLSETPGTNPNMSGGMCPTGFTCTPIANPSTGSPLITILSPSGGETFDYGAAIPVKYSTNYQSNSIQIHLYSPITGDAFISPKISIAANTTGFYTIPTVAVNGIPFSGGQYKINICDESQVNPAATFKPLCHLSDNYFTIRSSSASGQSTTASPTPTPTSYPTYSTSPSPSPSSSSGSSSASPSPSVSQSSSGSSGTSGSSSSGSSGSSTASPSPSTASTADTTPPTKPGSFTANPYTSTSIVLKWTPSTDNVGVTGYILYRDGNVYLGTITGTSYTDTGLTPDTTHNYTMAARDAAYNVSEKVTASAKTLAGTASPSPSTSSSPSPSSSTHADAWDPAAQSAAAIMYWLVQPKY